MIEKIVQKILDITKESNNKYPIISKSLITSQLKNDESIKDIKNIAHFYPDSPDFSFIFEGESFYFLNTISEQNTKIDYYFHTDINLKKRYDKRIPFLFVHHNMMYLLVIDKEGNILNFFKAKMRSDIPIYNYIVRNNSHVSDFESGYFNLVFTKENNDNFFSERNRKIYMEKVNLINMSMYMNVVNF